MFCCRYAKIEIDHSEPIIPFRETIVPPPVTDMVHEAILGDTSKQPDSTGPDARGVVDVTTASRNCSVRIRAVPLPEKVLEILSQNVAFVKTVNRLAAVGTASEKSDVLSQVGEQARVELQHFLAKLAEAFDESENKLWGDGGAVDRLWGISRNGTNVLLNCVEGYSRPSVRSGLEQLNLNDDRSLRDFDNAIVSGFMMATQAGPLCQEPMMGVCFVIERWELKEDERAKLSEVAEVGLLFLFSITDYGFVFIRRWCLPDPD